MAEIAEIENKHEGLQYKDNVTPARRPQEAEVEMISQEHTTLAGGSLSTNSTHIRMAAVQSYDLTNAASEEEIPIAEDVTRISTEESPWKKKYEMLLSRFDEEAGSAAEQEVSRDSTDRIGDETSPVRPRRRRKRMAIFGVVLFVLIFAPFLMIVILLTRKNPQQRASEIISFLNNMTFTDHELQYNASSTHPSDMALVWIIDTDRMKLTVEKDREHMLQRFALMTFIFGQGHKELLMGLDLLLHECDPQQFPVFNELWKCDSDNGLIREITAASSIFFGPLPEDVALFPGLLDMNFRNCSWAGPIPSSIGTMTQLTSLILSGNDFKGTIPSELRLLTNLASMDLHENQLTGTIPESIGEMINLQKLKLSHNDLNGTIPLTMGNLSLLRILWLQGNRLSGTLPLELAQHQPRDVLLFRNELTGPMPYCNVTSSTQGGLLAADCDLVECPCCSNCCPRAVGDVPMHNGC